MKTEFSPTWNSSTQPRKQRKFRYNAPLHTRRQLMSANLSKDLRKEFGTRNAELVKGDTVKIMRGDFKGEKGPVERLNTSRLQVFIKEAKRKKANGTEVLVPLQPSNLQIVEMNTKDAKRTQRLKQSKQPKAEAKPVQKK